MAESRVDLYVWYLTGPSQAPYSIDFTLYTDEETEAWGS